MDHRRITTLGLAALALAGLPAAADAHGRHGDRNHDGIPDRWQQTHRAYSARADLDRDGLNNRTEYRDHTDPRDADTDDDGIKDGREEQVGLNPTRRDSDRDGVRDDQENAGTVKSFTGGVLTITLASGGDVSGQAVDGQTEIECDSPDAQTSGSTPTPTARSASDGERDGHGDDQGDDSQGDDDQGDDNGDGSSSCGTADLTQGAVVKEAELETSGGQLVFHKVELLK